MFDYGPLVPVEHGDPTAPHAPTPHQPVTHNTSFHQNKRDDRADSAHDTLTHPLIFPA
jgi:hypothetical protein